MARPGVDALASCTLVNLDRPSPEGDSRLTEPSLGNDSRLTPPSVDDGSRLTHPSTADGSRLLAAHLLERTLLRLGRAGTLVDRRLSPSLRRIHSRHLYRLLGFVRLADYLTERLGMSLRRCQSILRLGRALDSLPRLGRALEAGEVSFSKVEIMAGVAAPETEALWLERAKRLTVSRLRDLVREAPPADASAPGSSDSILSAPTSPSPASSVAATSDPASSSRASSAPASSAPAHSLPAIEQEQPGRMISFDAPAPAFAIWHWCLDLIRRVAGQQEPAWRCAEYLAAEFLSGVPDVQGEPGIEEATGPAIDQVAGPAIQTAASPAIQAAAGPESALGSAAASPARLREAPVAEGAVAGRAVSTERQVGDAGMVAWSETCTAVREALVSIGSAADLDVIQGEVAASGIDELDAWELDARLRRLVRLRQSLAWRQGRILAALASLRLHRDLGFDTFDDWVADRLAMSPRRARYLISLDRRLRGLPLLADAYRRGLISWCQARLLVRIVHPSTQTRWVRYARQVTVRRLEDVVIACEVEVAKSAGASRSSSPAHVGAPPLPPSEPSPTCDTGAANTGVPDTGASHTGTADTGGADAGPGDSGPRHTSAPSSGPSFGNIAAAHGPIGRRIVFWAPLDVAAVWDSALRACRGAAGRHLDDWECFLVFVQVLRDTWENLEDPHWRRRHRIFERDGWRCMAPGCTSRSCLNVHHVIFRSQQGDDDDGNLVTLCIGHHQQGVHEGRIRCFGRAPGALWWDLGVKPAGEPLVRYFGERVVTRRPSRPIRPDAGVTQHAPTVFFAPKASLVPTAPVAGTVSLAPPAPVTRSAPPVPTAPRAIAAPLAASREVAG